MARPSTRREQVIERLREALRSGKLRPGSLVRTGIVEAQAWGTSHPTLRAALRELERNGEMIAAPRGFRVAHPTVRGTSTRVMWLAACDSEGTIAGESEREMRLRRHLDLACRRDGLHLRVAGVDSQGRVFLEGFPAVDLHTALKDTFGAVLCPWRMGTESASVVERLTKGSRPAALWGEGGIHRLDLTGSRARIFDNGHMATAGLGVGIHLRELGHQHILYLSVFQGSSWSKQRLEGLKSVIEPHGTVEPFAIDGLRHSLIAPDPPPDLLVPLLERLGRRAPFLVHRLAEVREAHTLLLREELLLQTMEPLLQRASAESKATAWVCSNDAQALLAMRWLRAKGVDIPGAVSVVGFDDSNLGQDQGLTSWSFSEPELAEAMVRHLVHPEIGAGLVRIDGALVVRGSTGKRAATRG